MTEPNLTSVLSKNIQIQNEFIKMEVNDDVFNHMLIPTWIQICQTRSIRDIAYVSIEDILEQLGMKKRTRKTDKRYIGFLESLVYLESLGYIVIMTDFKGLKMNDYIKVLVNKSKLKNSGNYTLLQLRVLDKIMEINSEISSFNLLQTYLYVKSYIYVDGNKDGVKAFFGSVLNCSELIALTRHTITDSLNVLVENDVLAKYSFRKNFKKPNIYVLKEDGWEEELEKAKKYLKVKKQYK